MDPQALDWKLMATTSGLLVVAELGDKTQHTVIALSTQHKNPWAVFLGASLALVLVTLVGVVVGQTLSHVLPQQLLHKAAAASFVVIRRVALVRGALTRDVSLGQYSVVPVNSHAAILRAGARLNPMNSWFSSASEPTSSTCLRASR